MLRLMVMRALAGLATAVLLAGCVASREDIPVRDGRSSGSTLEFSVASCNGNPSAEVTETADEVRVRVETKVERSGEGDSCLDGIRISLKEPLGTRRVVDAVTERTLTIDRR